ncbi:Phosphate transporter PHO1-like protein [Quillaja saponaria]|uniref:Phosphate transporter PHO1-like protein n=1 Tax=Quillaja saponaria TaxID=32244 RepID=A0AAD7Q3T4_QUISA|nr:Phosphate transporter PHO1-like protein [Quillaja saponaria]
MKFGKEFASQMVPEWQETYMNYNYLKSVLKDVLRSRQKNESPAMVSTPKGSLKRRESLYRAFSGLTGRYRGSPRKNEDEVILVRAVEREGSEGYYQTMFLMPAEEGGEYELVFFRRLDDEFNKVNNFYKKKVEEVMKEAEELSRQMDAMIALRIKVDKLGAEFTSVASSEPSTSASMVHHVNDRKHGQSHMDVIQEVEMSSERDLEDENRNRVGKTTSTKEQIGGKAYLEGFRRASLEILDHVKINIETPETLVSTLKGVLGNSKSNFRFSKQEMRKAEDLMSRAFTEFYQKLLLLKSYSFLNSLAFSKIMKKYDKITSRNASKDYLKMVDDSYICSSDEVTRLMERVEAAFIKHFANGNQ